MRTPTDRRVVDMLEDRNIARFNLRRQAAGRLQVARGGLPGRPADVRGSLGHSTTRERRPSPQKKKAAAVRVSDFSALVLVVAAFAVLYAFALVLWLLVRLCRLGRGISNLLVGGK